MALMVSTKVPHKVTTLDAVCVTMCAICRCVRLPPEAEKSLVHELSL
jgi:hypothetical protein